MPPTVVGLYAILVEAAMVMLLSGEGRGRLPDAARARVELEVGGVPADHAVGRAGEIGIADGAGLREDLHATAEIGIADLEGRGAEVFRDVRCGTQDPAR